MVNLELQTNAHLFTHARLELSHNKHARDNVKVSIIPITLKDSGYECQPMGDLGWKNLPLGRIERCTTNTLRPFVEKFEQDIASQSGEVWAFIDTSLQEYKLQLKL